MTSVLIVEDDAQIRRSLARLLSLNELESRDVASASAALESIRDSRPDLVLLDVVLGHGSGLDVLKDLRRVDPCRPAVVLMTGRRDLFPEISTALGPADDWITKPWDPQELIARLYLAVRRAR